MSEPSPEPSRRLRLFVHAYAFGAGAMLLVMGLVIAFTLNSAKHDARKRHAARVVGAEPTPMTAGAQPTEVKTGVYVDRISTLDFPAASWSVDFYLWFDWEGDKVDPGKRFLVVDGQIDGSQLLREEHEGTHHYQLHRVSATMSKMFDISRFPVDDHLLTIGIEDGEHNSDKLVFVADTANSSTSSRLKMPGYVPYRSSVVVRPHAYKTTRGDPHLEAGHVTTHSQLVYGIFIHRPDWGLFLKLFLTLYIAVAVSMLVFFINPTDVDARFGLSVGALFAVMANAYVISSAVPSASGLSMADQLTGIATLTLLLTLIQSTAALRLVHMGHDALAKRFDRLTFASMTAAFVVVNAAIPLAAS